MSDRSAIEWTQASWNPVTGCSKVSPGCAHCYAETFAERFRDVRGHHFEQGFDLRLWPERLQLPLRWRKPRRIFVNSMSDLFHPEIPDSFVAQVWDTMARAEWHTFQVLTKRPERIPGLLARLGLQDPPLQNVWIGTSIENRRFVGRADHLRRTPAAVRFISAEPLLGPLRCNRRTWPDGYTGPSVCLTGIDWLIVGGESGPGHRPVRPEWVRDLRDCCLCQFCRLAGERAPDCALCGEHSDTRAHPRFFFKQWGGTRPRSGGRELDGRQWDELPRAQGPDDLSLAAARGALGGALPSGAQGLGAGQRDAQPPTTRSLAPERAPRLRVRHSQPLGQTAATDPSPKIDVSAPASTGDMSREALASHHHSSRPQRRAGLGSRARHQLDRAASRLRDRYAQRVSSRGGGEGKWRWSHERAQGCEWAIRELLADATRPGTADLERRAERVLAVAHAILDGQPAAAGTSSPTPATRRRSGGGGEGGRSARGKSSSDTSRRDLADAGQTGGAIAEGECPDCFGCREPCAACIAAAGDPSPADFVLGPETCVEQVRRCDACGRVYGTYHAARALCFVMEAPGRRQVDRCVRCGGKLTSGTTSDCTSEFREAVDGGAGGGGGEEDDGAKASSDTSRPGGRVCERPGCGRPISDGSRPEARYCSKRCRQAVSRARVRERGPIERSERREQCAWCEGPMPGGRRGEAVFCSKRCRQASSRFGLAVTCGHRPASGETAASTGDTEPGAARAEDDTSPPGVSAEPGATRRTVEASGTASPAPAGAERLEIRARTVELVDGLIAAEQECFGAWCARLDRHGRVDPEAVIASQQPVRDAARRLRSWCANPHLRELAEVERLELLRAQAREEQAAQAAIEARRRKGEREEIRQAWNERRAWLYGARDALSIALGWPHRGEPVTVTGSYLADANGQDRAERRAYQGAGIYLHGYDTHNVSHQVWIPELDRKGRRFELIVGWQPRLERWGSADPGGDIALRRTFAPGARLPVPLPRWPTSDDVAAFCAPGERPDVSARAEPRGPRDTSPANVVADADAGAATAATSRGGGSSGPRATRRRPPRREILDDTSRPMRFVFADPPYPGKAGYYPERAEVDHGALIARLMSEFPDGWALATSAAALQDVLALCPPGVRVCSWHRNVRRTASRRPLAGWEPLIVHGGRELPVDAPQKAIDALEYRGRYRSFPGAIVGMKPPQYAVWLFQQLGARPGDALVDLYPGSGAVTEAWRRYTALPSTGDTSRPAAGARAETDTSPTPPRGEIPGEHSRAGQDARAALILFDDTGPSDASSEAGGRSAA